jgi:hypothetical protein
MEKRSCPFDDGELRQMRDAVYGAPTTENNWEHCRTLWAADWEWLYERFRRHGFSIVPASGFVL